jgi:hypothetical protein
MNAETMGEQSALARARAMTAEGIGDILCRPAQPVHRKR